MPRISLKAKKSRMEEVVGRLKKTYPEAKGALCYSNPLELLIATILSAQCTDERVNRVTTSLFKAYRSAQDYLDIPLDVLEKDIFSTGFYHNKAANIKKCCRTLVDLHNGEVPHTMDDLTALRGVGRKTANVVRGNVFGLPGIAVDTHVKRLSGLLGFTKLTHPDKIETDLMNIVPESDWTALGRAICIARRPKCDECILSDLCPSAK
jgi:endonuclease-3